MSAEQWRLLEVGAIGFVAALIGSMAKTRKLCLPHVYVVHESNGQVTRILDLGFLATPLLGAFVTAAFEHRTETALLHGLAIGYVGPAMINAIIDPILKRFGIHPEPLSSMDQPPGFGASLAGERDVRAPLAAEAESSAVAPCVADPPRGAEHGGP